MNGRAIQQSITTSTTMPATQSHVMLSPFGLVIKKAPSLPSTGRQNRCNLLSIKVCRRMIAGVSSQPTSCICEGKFTLADSLP